MNYVEIEVGDETITLKPTLSAIQKIDQRFGSLRGAIESVSNCSINAVVEVIAAGARLEKAERKDLPEKVFQAGVVNVMPGVTEYLSKLMDPTDSGGDDSGKD